MKSMRCLLALAPLIAMSPLSPSSQGAMSPLGVKIGDFNTGSGFSSFVFFMVAQPKTINIRKRNVNLVMDVENYKT
ncbi:MAG: hypothetical protein WC929_00480 [Bacilli bacterium]